MKRDVEYLADSLAKFTGCTILGVATTPESSDPFADFAGLIVENPKTRAQHILWIQRDSEGNGGGWIVAEKHKAAPRPAPKPPKLPAPSPAPLRPTVKAMILSAVLDESTPMTLEGIYNAVHGRDHTVGQPLVAKDLGSLVAAGEIVRTNDDGDVCLYERRPPRNKRAEAKAEAKIGDYTVPSPTRATSNITGEKFRTLLKELELEGHRTIGGLANKRTDLTRGQVTYLLKKLVAGGLVEKTKRGRGSYFDLTDLGRQSLKFAA